MKYPIKIITLLCLLTPLSLTAAPFIPEAAKKELGVVEFKNATVRDAIRIIAEQSDVNILATAEAAAKNVTFYTRNATVHTAIDNMCRVSGLWYRYNETSNAYLIMTAEQYRDDIVIYREDITRVFTLRHQNVETTAQVIASLFGGDRVRLNLDTEGDEDEDSIGVDNLQATSTNGGLGANNRQRTRTRDNDRNRRNRNNGSDDEELENLEGESISTQQIASLQIDESTGLPAISSEDAQRIVQSEPPIYVTINRFHNFLYVRTSDERAMQDIEQLVKESDRPVPQVLLEMKILEVDIGDGLRSAFNFNYADDNGLLNLGNFPTEGGTALFDYLNDNLNANIELLASEDKVDVIATPILLASNNRPAQLFIGEQRLLQRDAENESFTGTTGATRNIITVNTEVVDVGTNLTILPRINSDRSVTLELFQETSSIQEDSDQLSIPVDNGVVSVDVDSIDVSSIAGTVIVKDGLTVAVGGLIRKNRSASRRKVPLLGDIPIAGKLFSRDVEEDRNSELVLLITPHVFEREEEAEQRSRERIAALSGDTRVKEGFSAGTIDLHMRLVRHAAKQFRQQEGEIDNATLLPVPKFKTALKLFDNKALESKALHSWKHGSHYVTLLEITNQAKDDAVINIPSMTGHWKGFAVENRQLNANEKTYGYAISNQSFLDTLRESFNIVKRPKVKTIQEGGNK